MRCDYQIIGTGSKGNAVMINGNVLVDCGVSYKKLQPYVKGMCLVLLTHIHGDHFNASTVNRLAEERPTLRFGCGEWMVPSLVDAGVREKVIDIYEPEKIYDYGSMQISPVLLTHNVPNYGYKISFQKSKVFYATDTNDLNGISAPGYDLYMVEANYGEDEIHDRIKEKEVNGEYAYEKQVIHNHLSKEKCDEWITKNAADWSEFIYMHSHNGEFS